MPLIKDRISESEKKTQEEINKCIEQLTEIKKEQKKQGNQIALLVRMDFSTNSTRSRRQVQEHIKEASDNIIKGGFDFDSSNDEVSSAVGILFKGMEKQGIKVVKAEKGSILFTLLCPTVKSLRDVTLYLESPQIQPRLSYIEKAVEICHSCVAKITINVDLKSLQCATKKAGKGSVYLTLECNDEAGVRSAFKLFENGDSPNTLNKLSEALSREVGTKVELQTGIDIEKMKDTMEKAQASTNLLMHSTDYEVSNDGKTRISEELTELSADNTSNQQKEVADDLQKLKDTNLFETEETTEYKDLVSKVLRIKQQALKLDISVNQNLTEESKTQSEDLVRMLNETTAETAVLDYEKTLDTRSKQTEEIQKQIQETKQQHEKMKEEEEQKQIQLKKLKATVAKEQEIIDDMDRRIHQTEKPHEKMRKEEERQQIQLKELEATIAKKQEIIDDLNRRIHQVCIAEIKLCFELVL
ncbi:paramyosin-like isoform X3 [Mercenaria mercenaria]|nr:paramyosin-like isoform X3 [Mercenaria mercenaria]